MDPDPDPDPDPGHYFKIYWISLTKKNYLKIFCFILFAYFYPKTWWTIQKRSYNLSFLKSSDWGFRSKKGCFFCSFWLIFYPLDADPWIRIFLRIRIQEAKIFRILSTGTKSIIHAFIYFFSYSFSIFKSLFLILIKYQIISILNNKQKF